MHSISTPSISKGDPLTSAKYKKHKAINTTINTAINTTINTAINTAINTTINTAINTTINTAINKALDYSVIPQSNSSPLTTRVIPSLVMFSVEAAHWLLRYSLSCKTSLISDILQHLKS